LVRAVRPKSWADMSEDAGSQDDDISESGSWLSLATVSVGQAEKTTTKKGSWADMSDDVDSQDDDNASEATSGLDAASTVSRATTCSGQAERKNGRLRNKPLSRIEAMLSAAATQSSSCDTTSESSMTMSDSAESAGASFPLKVSAADEGCIVSLGSALHDLGGCKPCLFVNTHFGCQNGSLCEFCHFQHNRKAKQRPCKAKRDRYKKLLTRMNDDGAGSPDEMDSSIGTRTPRDQVSTVTHEQVSPDHLEKQ